MRSPGLLIALLLLLWGTGALGNALNVPADYATIQAAIDAANPGDEVVVQPGTYHELIDFKGKAITVRSTDPTDPAVVAATIVNGDGGGAVVSFISGEGPGSVLAGFTVVGGGYTSIAVVYCTGSSPTIANNAVTGHPYAGIYCSAGSPAITNNTITGNGSNSYAAIRCCDGSSPTISGNTVTGNGSQGVECSGGSATISGNTISGNGYHGIYCDQGTVTITDNEITSNTSFAGVHCTRSSATISGNTISGNGGGIYCSETAATIANNTITGNANLSQGGGIYCYASSGTIRDNAIRDNRCTTGSTYGGGGGVFCRASATDPLTISGNTITGNTVTGSGSGGGIYCYESSPTISGNTIDGNVGGGIRCFQGSSPVIWDNTIGNSTGMGIYYEQSSPSIVRNTVTDGVGGGVGGNGGSPTIARNVISNNRDRGISCSTPGSPRIEGNEVTNNGGGISANCGRVTGNLVSGNTDTQTYGAGGGVVCSNCTVSGNTITGNRVLSSDADCGGGGIYCLGTSSVVGNIITGNTTEGHGGGIYCWAGTLTISNNTISGNTSAQRGGGVYCRSGASIISNSTIAGNTASQRGGGIYGGGNASLTITNSVVALNVASVSGGGICWAAATPPDVRYCDVYGNTGGNYVGLPDLTGLLGNVSQDPLFADAPGGDFHLKSTGGRWVASSSTWVFDAVTSPGVDAGDPASDYSKEPAPNGARINMGAEGNTAQASKTALPPTAPTLVSIQPRSPNTNDVLTASARGGGDPNGRALAYEFEWCESTDGGSTWGSWGNAGPTLPASETTKGEWWKARGRTVAGTQVSDWTESTGKAIGDAAPGAPTGVTIAPASPQTAADLRATGAGATDADGDELTYQVQWASSTDGGTTWSPWGDPGQVLPNSRTTKGERWKARARADDGELFGPWLASAPVTVADTIPTAPVVVTVSPSSPLGTDALKASASGSVDADGDALTYEYQWSKSTNSGTSWSAWGNAGATLPASLTTKGHWWRTRGRAVAAGKASAWTISAAVVIGNTGPTGPTSVVIAPGSPLVGQDLVATADGASDPDGDPLRYEYEWCRRPAGAANWGAWGYLGQTLPASQAALGDRWKVRARAVDPGTGVAEVAAEESPVQDAVTDYSPWVESALVTIRRPVLAAAAPERGGADASGVGPAALTSLSAIPRASGAQIMFTLSRPATVEVAVLNIAGRPIRTIGTGEDCASGLNTIAWTGLSDAGLPVPAGLYLVRVTARGTDGGQSSAVATVMLR